MQEPMDTTPNLSPIIPSRSPVIIEDEQKTPFHLQTFLRPSSKGQLKRPTYTKNPNRNRKLSTDDMTLRKKPYFDRTGENRTTHIALMKDQSNRAHDLLSDRDAIKNKKNKAPQRNIKKSDVVEVSPLVEKQPDNHPKTLLRSSTVTFDDNCLHTKKEQNVKNDMEKEPKSLQNLAAAALAQTKSSLTERIHSEQSDNDIFSSSPTRSTSRIPTLMNIQNNSLKRRLKKEGTQILESTPLSNMIRRKSCHCSDCGGLSNFEKRHLNVVTRTKREEMHREKLRRENRKKTGSGSPTKGESRSSLKSTKNTRLLMKLKPKFDAIISGVRNKVTNKESNAYSSLVLKDRHVRTSTLGLDSRDFSSHVLDISAGVLHKTLPPDRLYETKPSLNLIEEFPNLKKSESKEIIIKEHHAPKTNASKKEIHSDKVLVPKLSLNEVHSKKSPDKVFIQNARKNQVSLQKFITKEEKKLVKRLDKKNMLPSKSNTLTAKVLSKANEAATSRHVGIASIEEHTLQKSLTSRQKSRDKLVVETYGVYKKLVEEKVPISVSATLQSKRMISFESLPKLELTTPILKPRLSTLKGEVSSMHIKNFDKKNRLTIDSAKSGAFFDTDYSTDRHIHTDRDLPSAGERSSKFFDYLGMKINTEPVQPNEDSFKRTKKLIRINTEKDLKGAYKKQGKVCLTERSESSRARFSSVNIRPIV